MKLLETYNRQGIYNNRDVDFVIWGTHSFVTLDIQLTETYIKFPDEGKIITRTSSIAKERWINTNNYKRIPRKINQQDSLG